MFRLVPALFLLAMTACAEPAVAPFDEGLAEREIDCSDLREKIAALYAEARAAVAELEAEQAQQLARLDAWYGEQQAKLDRRYRAALAGAETRREVRRITAAYEEASAALALEARRLHHEIVSSFSAEIRETIADYLQLIERLKAACERDVEPSWEPYDPDRI